MKNNLGKFISSTISQNKYQNKMSIILSSFTFLNIFFGYKVYKKINEYLYLNHEEITHIVYFKLEKNNKYYGTIDIGLFGNKAPKSINNFICLASNENIKSYKNSVLNKIVPNYIISLGQLKEGRDNKDFISIYDNAYIEDEMGDNRFCEPGLVALCNKGSPNTNVSQFFITLDDLPMFNDKFIVIGRVLKGLDSLNYIANEVGTLNGTPLETINISDCGIYNYEDYFKV